jgi:hypothetical protein
LLFFRFNLYQTTLPLHLLLQLPNLLLQITYVLVFYVNLVLKIINELIDIFNLSILKHNHFKLLSFGLSYVSFANLHLQLSLLQHIQHLLLVLPLFLLDLFLGGFKDFIHLFFLFFDYHPLELKDFYVLFVGGFLL